MPVIPWLYGTAISGVSFPMVTASGTLAAGYSPGSLSAVISKDGGAWADLSGRISGIPGNGVYTLVSLSSTEMTCYTWTIKVTANSGCLDQILMGVNGSGPALGANLSGFATRDSVSGLPGIYLATSGLANKNDVSGNDNIYTTLNTRTSGIPGVAASISGLNTSNLISQCSSIIGAVSNVTATVNYSSIANQVWNTLTANNTSATTFGGSVLLSGQGAAATVDNSGIAQQVWNTVRTVATSATTFGGYVLTSGQWANVSGLDSILNACSGNDNILTAVNNRTSGIPGLTVQTANILAATSGLKNDVSGLPGVYLATSGLANKTDVSGNDNIYTTLNTRTSGIPGIATSVSGLNTSNVIAQCSSILAGVSGVPSGVGLIPTTTAASLTSGTLAHDMRLIRRFSWGNLNIDKTYTPVRMYLEGDDGNMSSYFQMTDDANNTIRSKV